eukprot:gene2403-2707_t
MVIDDGVDFYHNDLQPQVDKANSITFASFSNNLPSGGAECVDKGNTCYHGSHVTGTAAGAWGGGDTRGIAGLAGPAANSIISCNTFGTSKGAAITDIVRCLQHAVSRNAAWVINMSLGGIYALADASVSLLREAMQAVCNAGGIIVVAAGNDGRDVLAAGYDANGNYVPGYGYFPAALAAELSCVIAVANLDSSGALAASSNWGAAVGIAAPGDDKDPSR